MQDLLENELRYNSYYVTKVDIIKNRVDLKKLGFGKATKKQILTAFNNCEKKYRRLGNPYNRAQQKHVAYVNLFELHDKTFKH